MTDVRRALRGTRAVVGPVIGRAAIVLVAAASVLAVLLGLLVLGPPPATDPPRCPVLAGLPPLPEVEGAAQPALIAGGNELARRGRLDQAERVYDVALRAGGTDPGAGRGLAYVEARRAQAVDRASGGQRVLEQGDRALAWSCFTRALERDNGNDAARSGLAALRAPETRNVVERLADGWDAVHERWFAPMGRSIGPFLAVLAVLLVLARLLTPVAVPVTATAWPDRARRAAWIVGTALLVLAAARTTAFAQRGATDLEGTVPVAWRVGVLIGVLALTALLLGWSRYAHPWWQVAVFLPLVVGLGYGAGELARRGALAVPFGLWPWALALALAGLGLVLVAAGRGHALRLRVTVRKGRTPDAAGTAYVLARLEELGTSPPEGLKAPQQVDITDLPTAALTGLPGGRIAAALATTARLLQVSVPWQAAVEDGGDGRMVVTVTRNGPVVRTAIIDGERFRETTAAAPAATSDGGGDPVGGSPTVDQTREPRNLLTAAAAVILTELAVKHPKLTRGLCGATQWDSVAAHVVATRPQLPVGTEEFQRQLLGFAVQRDPDNALARAALVQRLGSDARTGPEFAAHAERLHALLRTIDGQRTSRSRTSGTPSRDATPPSPEEERDRRDGYTPLRLRTLHALTAAWLNAAACRDVPGSVDRARTAYRRLHALLDDIPATTREDDSFLRNLGSVADELREALRTLGSPDDGLPGPFVRGDPDRPRSLSALYDRACRRAYDGNGSRDPSGALEDLRLAVADPKLRRQARTDPWLRSLHEREAPDAGTSAAFRRIVGPADSTSSVDGPPKMGMSRDRIRQSYVVRRSSGVSGGGGGSGGASGRR